MLKDSYIWFFKYLNYDNYFWFKLKCDNNSKDNYIKISNTHCINVLSDERNYFADQTQPNRRQNWLK